MKSNFTCIKKMPVYLLSASFCLGMFSCQDDVRTDGYSTADVPELHALSAEQKEVIDYTPKTSSSLTAEQSSGLRKRVRLLCAGLVTSVLTTSSATFRKQKTV